MDKDSTYESFDLDTGLWDDTDNTSETLKTFRKDFELYEAERTIVTRLLAQMLNLEDGSRD